MHSDASPRRLGHRFVEIPGATVARLPVYLRALELLVADGVETTSSESLAESVGVNPAQLRKDLSFLGSHGTRGVGYDVVHLGEQVRLALGLHHQWRVAIVGIGNLGHALANYAGLTDKGVQIVALLDADPAVVGTQVAGLTVSHVADLEAVVARELVAIAVLAVPVGVAQPICDRLVAVGVHSILNFAPLVLQVPDHVVVRQVDLATELQILSFHEQRNTEVRGG